jgi:hypothetical protein
MVKAGISYKGIKIARISFYDKVKTMGDLELINNIPVYTSRIVVRHHYLM